VLEHLVHRFIGSKGFEAYLRQIMAIYTINAKPVTVLYTMYPLDFPCNKYNISFIYRNLYIAKF
ncbi:uncharacterized protein METZ01_LOCUS139973, partial [marine metagenome]